MGGALLAIAASAAVAVGALGCGGDESERVAVAGDIGLTGSGPATLGAMAGSGADTYIALGDLSYGGPDSEAEFCGLVQAELGTDAAFEIVAGNHEDDSGVDGFVGEFARCLPDRVGAVGDYGRQYYFDLGELARFILISPDLTVGGHRYDYARGPDARWVDSAIDDAREQGIDWVIVGMHKVCVSAGVYSCEAGEELFARLIDRRVDLVLSGHDHGYQRSKQLGPAAGCERVPVADFDADCTRDADGAYTQGAGTTFVVSAAAGADFYRLDPEDPERRYFAAAMGAQTKGARHGFALLSISPDALEVEFTPSSSGTFADRVVIQAAPSGD